MTLLRGRLRRLIDAVSGRPVPDDVAAIARLAAAAESLRRDVASIHDVASAMAQQLESLRARVDQLADRERQEIGEAADFAALPVARLLSDRLRLEGSPSRRLGVRRHTVGRSVALPVRRWMGVTECATRTPEVRGLWDRLMTTEEECDDVLRGEPGSVLELTDAVVMRGDPLRISLPPAPRRGFRLQADDPRSADIAAVPRFTYDFPARKQRNVGHWLLDCVPQVLALARLAPDAAFLLPSPWREVHWQALALAGIDRGRVIVWDDTPIACRRLFVQEADGRVARGRPLPMLLDFRRRLLEQRPVSTAPWRRIFVSRRDAKPHRQWMANHDEVEALFRARGFEILAMRHLTMDEQVQAFREAEIVAGVSGAGLANIAFADAGTHVIALLTDGLMRWYAEEHGSRSQWTTGKLPAGGSINELSDSPRFYAHLAAACGQHCHTFVGEDLLPIDALRRFLDAVLERVANA